MGVMDRGPTIPAVGCKGPHQKDSSPFLRGMQESLHSTSTNHACESLNARSRKKKNYPGGSGDRSDTLVIDISCKYLLYSQQKYSFCYIINKYIIYMSTSSRPLFRRESGRLEPPAGIIGRRIRSLPLLSQQDLPLSFCGAPESK